MTTSDASGESGRRQGEVRRRETSGRLRTGLALPVAAPALAAVLLLAGPPGGPGPSAAAGQEAADDRPDIHLGGLLRTGFRAGPSDLGRSDGFRLYDARLRARGEIGIVFDYFVQAEFDSRADRLRLLDARLSLPVIPELAVELGQFRPPFGREALQGKGEITFVERSQASQVVAPGRQVGLQLAGRALDDRLTYRGGVFNGNGRSLSNDGDSFLWAARVSYNTVGPAQFYDELVVEVGASVAASSDSAAPLAGGAELPADLLAPRDPGVRMTGFRGDRLLLGIDASAAYRGFFLRGEYLRGEFDPEGRFAAPPPPTDFSQQVAEGGYLEGGYSFLGAIEGVVRWDAFSDFLARVDGVAVDEDVLEGDASEVHFLVFGLNLFPGRFGKVGLQYAVGLSGARRGPGVADGEFSLNAQVDF